MSLRHILTSLSERQRESLYKKLQSIYFDLEKDYQELPKPCTQCGACCHFDSFGHKLYVSSLEFAYVYEHTLKKEDFQNARDACPYLNGRSCEAREYRMLGCRTFFRLHSEQDAEKANELYEIYLSKMKELYREAELNWEYKDFMVFVKEVGSVL